MSRVRIHNLFVSLDGLGPAKAPEIAAPMHVRHPIMGARPQWRRPPETPETFEITERRQIENAP